MKFSSVVVGRPGGSCQPIGVPKKGKLAVVGSVTVQWSGLVLRTEVAVMSTPSYRAVRLVDEFSVKSIECKPGDDPAFTDGIVSAAVITIKRPRIILIFIRLTSSGQLERQWQLESSLNRQPPRSHRSFLCGLRKP